jgi:hypothetical protein
MLGAEPSQGPPTQRVRRALESQSLTRLSLFCWLKIPLRVANCSLSPPSDGSRGESSQGRCEEHSRNAAQPDNEV